MEFRKKEMYLDINNQINRKIHRYKDIDKWIDI